MDLNSEIVKFWRLTEVQKKALSKMGILTVEDLLYHFPAKYGNTFELRNIDSIGKGEVATLFGRVSGLKTSKAFYKKIPMSEGFVTDESGKIKLLWFNQPYIAKMIHENQLVRVEGKVSERKGELYMSNPKVEVVSSLPDAVGTSLFGKDHDDHALHPVYSESRGITSNWMFHAIQKAFAVGVLDKIFDPIPEEILKKYSLPNIKTALIWIHSPKKEENASIARKRFAFQEILFIQLQKQKEKNFWQEKKAFNIEISKKDIDDFIKRFPFKPTDSQMQAINSITNDLKRGYPMSRLLEGDVGSGKTAVAAATVYAVTRVRPNGKDFGNLQVAYMAPTEILAKQHYESFIKFFNYLPIKIGLITGSECQIFPSKSDPTKPTKISRAQLLKWLANGEVPILIGTHSLIQKTVKL
jgi:ATP-dependent DNA helicase RecG